MERSLMQLGIADLEALFSNSKADSKVLRQLEHELQHRKVPRAVSLLADVRKALSSLVRTAPAASAKSPTLDHRVQQFESQKRSSTPVGSTTDVGSQHLVIKTEALPFRPITLSESSLPPLGIEEACKILKVAAAATWEVVEHSRRELVDKAHPARLAFLNEEQRQKALDEATRVNLAYATLSAARCGSSLTLVPSQPGVVEQ